MHIRRHRAIEAQRHVDHRLAQHRALGEAAMYFDVIGAQQCARSAGAHAVDDRLVEDQRHALRRRRRTAHARLEKRPVDDEGRRLARRGDGERPVEFAEQQSRLIDLRGNKDVADLKLHRRLVALEESRRCVASHLETERIAAETFRAAGIDPAGLGFARAPALDGRLRLAGGGDPEPAPAAEQGSG